MRGQAETRAAQREIAVWDLVVRLFHWSLVLAFLVAFFTGDDSLALHVWAGYAVGGLIVLRLIWGFVGTEHARFSDFVTGPFTALGYLMRLVRFRAERYVGHSPAGGVMILALLAVLAVAVWSGLETYGIDRHAGPLASAPALALVPAAAAQDDDEDEAFRSRDGRRRSSWQGIHALFGNLTMLIVILHIGGVVLGSVAHRENLAWAMVTGRKRPPEAD